MTSTATYHSLKDRVVIITGGGQGLGRAYAHHLAEQGAIPVIAEIDGARGEQVAAEVRDLGGRALAVETDVGELASATHMAEAALGAFGRIDCLINNAAIFSTITMAPFWELPVEEWQRAIHVNVTGAFFCARAVVPAMQDAGWGRIINLASTTVALGRVNYLHYITSKSALIGMTRSMARELGQWNITVNLLWPGAVATEIERPSVSGAQFEAIARQQCLPRPAEMQDIARVMLFLCSDESGYMTGQGVQANGGLAFL
jgi:3-oxoacyl-[acyl-carrier protein] reductase